MGMGTRGMGLGRAQAGTTQLASCLRSFQKEGNRTARFQSLFRKRKKEKLPFSSTNPSAKQLITSVHKSYMWYCDSLTDISANFIKYYFKGTSKSIVCSTYFLHILLMYSFLGDLKFMLFPFPLNPLLPPVFSLSRSANKERALRNLSCLLVLDN